MRTTERRKSLLAALVCLGGLALPSGALAGDKDKDGIANKTDECAEEPEDKDGFEDDNGCPDPDNDKDGAPDGADDCPDEPEDKDDFEDDNGCPDPDNDKDGVPDPDDRCPEETEDGDDKDGCAAVSLQLLTESGWMAAIASLNEALLGAASDKDDPCGLATSAAERWLSSNDPDDLERQWQDRLGRAGPEFDAAGANALLGSKGEVYQTLAPALELLCGKDPSWSPVGARISAVYGKLPPPPPRKPKPLPRRR